MGLGLSWQQAALELTAPCSRSRLDYPTSGLHGDTGPSLALLPEWIKAKPFYIPLFCCAEVAAQCVKHLTSICHLSIQSSPAKSKDFMHAPEALASFGWGRRIVQQMPLN